MAKRTATSTINPESARAELAFRRLATIELQSFCRYVAGWWKPAPHLDLAIEKLEQVARYIETGGREGIGRLIVEMPPRHGKSVLVSQFFPAWLLGRNPDLRIILTSYNADLAAHNSRKLREVVTSKEFNALFGARSAVDEPVIMAEDSRAKANWDLAAPHRGGCTSAGVGGGLTGKGAHLLVVDDPFKNREEAASEARRRTVLSWFSSSAYSRLEKGGAVVIIHTRWHREDLIGQMLSAMATSKEADQWEVVSMPALAYGSDDLAKTVEEHKQALLNGLWKPLKDALDRPIGQALWPSMYDERYLAGVKASYEATGNMQEWWSLYQQSPRPLDGGFFGLDDFQIIDRAPEGLQWYRYVDLALSSKATADFNATVAAAMNSDADLYFRDMVRMRGWVEFKRVMKQLMLSPEETGTVWGIESVAFQSLAFQELQADTDLMGVPIYEQKVEGDKVQRAQPFRAKAKAGKVYLVRGPWVREFINEALEFGNGGAHDDQIDTASGGVQMIAEAMQRYTRLHVAG